MVYKRYYGPFEEKREPIHIAAPPVCELPQIELAHEEKTIRKNKSPLDLFGKCGVDDFLILGILLILFMEDRENRDVPLILALGFLLLIQYIEAE